MLGSVAPEMLFETFCKNISEVPTADVGLSVFTSDIRSVDLSTDRGFTLPEIAGDDAMKEDTLPASRIIRAYQQTIHAIPDALFPLLCPVRESAWLDG